jgi:hypothetical protein
VLKLTYALDESCKHNVEWLNKTTESGASKGVFI